MRIFLVKKDISEFALKTLSILANHNGARTMAKNAIESAQQFSVKTTVDSLEAIYYKLLVENNKLSVAKIMAENKRSEEFFVFHLSFWAFLLISRFLIFLFHTGFSYPQINLGGSNFTLPTLGVFLIFLSLALTLLSRSINFLSLILLGGAAGLIGSEFASILTRQATVLDYWNPWNLIPIILFGTLPLLFSKVKIKETPRFFINTRQSVHQNPENPKVSVVIPAYNEADFIETTLKSLLAQTFRDFEIIVVDNNSTDGTGEVAARYGARVIVEKQKGVAWARQAGFMQARGQIIASTDSDSVVSETWLAHIVEQFERDSELVAYGGLGCLYSGPVDARAAGRFLFPLFWIIDRYLSGGWNLNGFNLAVRREAFIKIGGFRTEMTLGEDIDLAKRLREIGKVNVDTKFMVYVSGRRYKDGLIPGMMTYVPSYIMRVVFGKDEFLSFPAVRSERAPLRGVNFLPITILLLVLIVLFYLSRPAS